MHENECPFSEIIGEKNLVVSAKMCYAIPPVYLWSHFYLPIHLRADKYPSSSNGF